MAANKLLKKISTEKHVKYKNAKRKEEALDYSSLCYYILLTDGGGVAVNKQLGSLILTYPYLYIIKIFDSCQKCMSTTYLNIFWSSHLVRNIPSK